MKRFLMLVALLLPFSVNADPEGAYWIVVNGAAEGQFASADEACQAYYNDYIVGIFADGGSEVGPYAPPTDAVDQRAPNAKSAQCPAMVNLPPFGWFSAATFLRQEINCEAGSTYNPGIGKCQAPTEDQEQNEIGDPSQPSPGVVVTCAGDPVNTPTGNVFETESDYASGDGELAFSRSYNSADGTWRHTYSASLVIDPVTMVVTFDDGRGALYPVTNGIPAPAVGRRDRLESISGQWVYTSEDNEVLTFNTVGALVGEQSPDGLKRSITRAAAPGGATGDTLVTVTGARGRVMSFVEGADHTLKSLQANSLSVSYGYNTAGMLSSVTSSAPNLSTSKSYTYDDARNGTWLTSETDENGVVFGTWSYDAQGRAVRTAHPSSADQTTFDYPTDDSVVVTNALGNKVTYLYEINQGAKRPVSVSGEPAAGCPASNSTFHNDVNGYPDTVVRANGTTTALSYDTGYNEISRVEAKGTPSERTTQTVWDSVAHQPAQRSLLDASGTLLQKSSWQYNSRRQVLATCKGDVSAPDYVCSATGTPPSGVRRTTVTYCDAVDTTACPLVGLVLSVDGPRDDVQDVATRVYYMDTDESGCAGTSGACHKKGDLYQSKDALGHTKTVLRYDADGRPIRFSDVNGIIHDASYDPLGRILTTSVRSSADGTPSAGDATNTFAYNSIGELTATTDPDGVVLGYSYDDARRLTDITDGSGNRIHYTLDLAGNRTKEETFGAGGALKRSVSHTFNSLGQLLTVVDALNRTVLAFDTTDGYDAEGNSVHSADAKGVQRKQGYDALNRLVSTIDDYNGVNTATANTQTVSTLDASDNLEAVSDPSNLNTIYDHNGWGDLTGIHSPDTGTTTFTVDASGNRLTQTDARGVVTTYAYDALNRTLSTSYADATLNISYHYDEANAVTGCAASAPVGRLTRIIESSVTTTYCYDPRGNVVQKKQVQGTATDTLGYTYTQGGRVATETRPSGALVRYGYDALGQVSGVWVTPLGGTEQPVASSITWLPFGPMLSYTLGSGQAVTRTYDANYAVTDIVSPALELHFSRDAMGNITGVSEAGGGSASYGYDPLYRLTSVNDAGGNAVEAYTYNQTGDRTGKTGPGLATGAYTYQAGAHWLTGIGAASRAYDANGNTTGTAFAGNVWGYGYDGRNRLTGVQQNGVAVGTYAYNARQDRIAKSAANATTRFIYDETDRLLGEFSSTTSRDYVAVAGVPVGIVDVTAGSPVFAYVVADFLGSPRAVTSAAGSVMWAWPYALNPFGESVPTSSSGYVLGLRFPGQYFDTESGLIYNHHRYYDPTTGRYIQSDPAGLIAGTATYGYVGGRPLGSVDRFGLQEDDKEETSEWERERLRAMFNPTQGQNLAGEGVAARANYELDAENMECPRVEAFGPNHAGEGTGRQTFEFQQRYLSGRGGRWGGPATRAQNVALREQFEALGFVPTNGGGAGPEEWIAGPGGTVRGGRFADITMEYTHPALDPITLRIQTVSTRSDGVTPTRAETDAARAIQAANPKDILIMVPKGAK